MPAGPPAHAERDRARQLGGRYQLIRYLAKGGMAEVWEGYDAVLSRPVAVKMLLPHLASDEGVLERFRREAITAASLAHPGVIATFDTGVDGDTAYIVMELVRGRTLRHLMSQQGVVDPGLAVRIVGQITDALAHAHRCGLVHRDIKPANVLLCDDDGPIPRAKVTDFGIAKATEGLGLDLTQTGIVLGTPKYLSPEQVEGMEPDARADLYSLGVVFFEMLAGRAPFVAPTDMATALARLREDAPRVSSLQPGVPRELDDLVAGLLVKDRDARRPPTAVSLRRELAALTRRVQPRTSTPVAPVDPQPTPAAIAGAVGHTGPWGQQAPTPPASTWGPPAVAPRSFTTGAKVVPGPPLTARPPVAPAPSRPAPVPLGPPPALARRPEPARPAPVRPQQRGRRAPTRPHRAPGVVVAGLVIVGVVFVGLLLGKASGGGTTVSAPRIVAVTELLPNGHKPDNTGQLPALYDGSAGQGWSSADYNTAQFSGLYAGLGLVIQLDGTHPLDQLAVTSATQGWSAQVYTAASRPDGGVGAWGAPVATVSSAPGDATLALGGRSGGFVLLYLTNLGAPLSSGAYQITINELAVR